jgi:SDR family mycofactocin-dependent oxidoreductase
MNELEGKTVLITGAARGQGRSHAVVMAKAGAAIVAVDICGPLDAPYRHSTPADLDRTVELVEAEDARCMAQVADVRDRSQLEAVVNAATAEFGAVDVLVANAGILAAVPLVEMTDTQWKNTIDTNLTGVYNAIRAVLPGMIERRQGRIIATSSMGGRNPYANTAHYVAAKWGVIGLVKTAALEAGQYGITVNAVCPTNVNTEMIMNDSVFKIYRPDLKEPTETDVLSVMSSMHPLGIPYVEPVDISNAVLFLASDAARYISGEALTVSAGAIATNTA